MKLIFIIFLWFIPSILSAQIIERETAIFNFTKGEVSVVFHDTISPDQAHQLVDSLGLKIIHQSMSPVSYFRGTRLDSLKAEALRSNPDIAFFESAPMIRDTSTVRTPATTSPEQRKEILERMMGQYSTRILFQYHITREQAISIIQSLGMEDVINTNNIRTGPRVVTVEVPVGQEDRYMQLLHRQSIVKNTARIAIPDYE